MLGISCQINIVPIIYLHCRMYIEQYSDDTSKHGLDAQDALGPIIKVALDISKLQEYTGRDKPTVIT